MKRLFVLILTLGAFHGAFAQQHRNTDNMTITVDEPADQPRKAFNVIVTRTDSAQLQKDVDRTPFRKAKNKDQLAVREALLQSIIQPYIDQGWQLISTSVQVTVTQGANQDYIYRYYLSKQK